MNNLDYVALASMILMGANGWLLLNIKLQVAELKIAINRDFISKDDFSKWTNRSSALPSFKKDE
jgi:hypothetical protein